MKQKLVIGLLASLAFLGAHAMRKNVTDAYQSALAYTPAPVAATSAQEPVSAAKKAKEEVANIKTAVEITPVIVVDPYQSAHALFAVASTKEDYDAVIMAYNEAQKAAFENEIAIATTNKGEARLAVGDVVGGFTDRDARLNCPEDARLFKPGVFVALSNPLQTTSQNIQGSTVAVYCDEGGIGDIYFFCRYMKELKKRGAKVIGVATTPFVQKILNSLVENGIADQSALFAGKRENFTGAHYDYDIHMMSLPACVSTEGLTASTLATIPQEPWLDATKARLELWQNKINAKKGLHIAYCFAASKRPAGVYRRLERDIEQGQLEGVLTTVPDVATLYCIQGPGTKTTGEIVNIADEESRDSVPFAHTIALLAALKDSKRGMFVGIDTGPTNAALAVGTPGLVLLPRVADWRWGVAKTPVISDDQTPSVWAPSLRIIRQDKQGDWSVPLSKLKTALTETSVQVKTQGALK